jgi:hypothetical protein
MPVEENDTEFELQALNPSSKGGRCEVEIVGGPFHRAGLSQGNKSLKFREHGSISARIKLKLHIAN